jgi:hypothetical protein
MLSSSGMSMFSSSSSSSSLFKPCSSFMSMNFSSSLPITYSVFTFTSSSTSSISISNFILPMSYVCSDDAGIVSKINLAVLADDL